MKNKSPLSIFVFAFVVLTAAIVTATVFLYGHSYFDSLNTILTFAIGILSLLISVIALLVALVTYSSIDSVNVISSMEGNVLCNENYNAEYAMLVEKYRHCTDQEQLEKAMFENLHRSLRKHSGTCMQFTDCLQDILDHILWYAYTDMKSEAYQKHTEKLVKLIDKRYENFNAISNGNQYLLREHIKLIKNVMNYQSVVHEGGAIDANKEMLNIRGRMFRNSVSRTIYYDYLGLEYHKKATNLLRKLVGFEKEEFLQENMRRIRDYPYTQEQRDEICLYLNKAGEAFAHAEEASAEDILWKGYITFNRARIDLIRALMENRFAAGWDQSINAAVDARYAVCKLFAPQGEPSFLHAELEKEYHYARALRLSMHCFLRTDDAVQEQARQILQAIPKSDEENGGIYRRTRSYLEDVLAAQQ